VPDILRVPPYIIPPDYSAGKDGFSNESGFARHGDPVDSLLLESAYWIGRAGALTEDVRATIDELRAHALRDAEFLARESLHRDAEFLARGSLHLDALMNLVVADNPETRRLACEAVLSLLEADAADSSRLGAQVMEAAYAMTTLVDRVREAPAGCREVLTEDVCRRLPASIVYLAGRHAYESATAPDGRDRLTPQQWREAKNRLGEKLVEMTSPLSNLELYERARAEWPQALLDSGRMITHVELSNRAQQLPGIQFDDTFAKCGSDELGEQVEKFVARCKATPLEPGRRCYATTVLLDDSAPGREAGHWLAVLVEPGDGAHGLRATIIDTNRPEGGPVWSVPGEVTTGDDTVPLTAFCEAMQEYTPNACAPLLVRLISAVGRGTGPDVMRLLRDENEHWVRKGKEARRNAVTAERARMMDLLGDRAGEMRDESAPMDRDAVLWPSVPAFRPPVPTSSGTPIGWNKERLTRNAVGGELTGIPMPKVSTVQDATTQTETKVPTVQDATTQTETKVPTVQDATTQTETKVPTVQDATTQTETKVSTGQDATTQTKSKLPDSDARVNSTLSNPVTTASGGEKADDDTPELEWDTHVEVVQETEAEREKLPLDDILDRLERLSSMIKQDGESVGPFSGSHASPAKAAQATDTRVGRMPPPNPPDRSYFLFFSEPGDEKKHSPALSDAGPMLSASMRSRT
jgi:hypothetical protein